MHPPFGTATMLRSGAACRASLRVAQPCDWKSPEHVADALRGRFVDRLGKDRTRASAVFHDANRSALDPADANHFVDFVEQLLGDSAADEGHFAVANGEMKQRERAPRETSRDGKTDDDDE